MNKEEWQALPFEEALKRLEEVVDSLEKGEVPLEHAINLFQEGMLLSQICHGKLEKVEQQIETMSENNGELVVKPMEFEVER